MVYAVDFANPTINPTAKFMNISSLLNVIIPSLMIGAGILFLLMFVYAGFWFMNSDGNPENLKKTKEHLRYSLIGLAIVIASYVIVKLIATIFKIENVPL